MDRHLFAHTRFFGAASVIAESLNYLTTAWGRLMVSAQARFFLAGVGAELERINMQIAQSISCGRLRSPGLDGQIVYLEQAWVQQRLAELQAQAPNVHRELLEELDLLLSFFRFSVGPRSVGWAILQHVLTMLRDRLRRPLEFARQDDREAIGHAIIELLKRGTGR
ncbi:MAG: repeat-associated core protein [Gammaproteobacteria bacterium]|nr:repeat-associated core protein [Gammaproteobacteria bacterium]